MNDEHDNAQTDNEMIRNLFKKAQEGDPSVVVWGDVDIDIEPSAADLAAVRRDNENIALKGVAEPDLDEDEVTATIRASMSDLEIVNEIIRVAGYERTGYIADMLDDLTADYLDGEG